MKHKEYITIDAVLTCLTGLKIGGSKGSPGPGETDNPIIRHPITRLPFIPGSSLKGKVRSLLESKYSPSTQRSGGVATEAPGGSKDENHVTALFGSGDMSRNAETQPTRAIFRDAFLTDESKKTLMEALPGTFSEVKPEIAMDRNQGKTKGGSLRENERVPADTSFSLSLTVRLFIEDDPRRKRYFELLAEGFRMLEDDYLGGNGTRGYGKVKILSADGRPLYEYLRTLE